MKEILKALKTFKAVLDRIEAADSKLLEIRHGLKYDAFTTPFTFKDLDAAIKEYGDAQEAYRLLGED